MTLAPLRLIEAVNPSYVQVLKEGILSITSFSLLRKGTVSEYDISSKEKNSNYRRGYDSVDRFSSSQQSNSRHRKVELDSRELSGDYLWPNELSQYTDKRGAPVMLISDGFLLPGQNDGGLFAITNPHLKNSRPVRITETKPGWFHHKAVYVKLPGGTEGVLTARASKPLLGIGRGELVWLTSPKEKEDAEESVSLKDSIEDLSSNIEDDDIIDRFDPPPAWSETILVEGPDVMFEVLDVDSSDGSLEVIAAHFFGKKLSVHSIRAVEIQGDGGAPVEVHKTEFLDTEGRPYGLCLANLNSVEENVKKGDSSSSRFSHVLVSTHECTYDIPSAISMAVSAIRGGYPRILSGSRWGSLEGGRAGKGITAGDSIDNENFDERGGSLFAYKIPRSEDGDNAWTKHSLFRGFKVRGWGGIFSPGAPGFPYAFRMPDKPNEPPLILLAGDCTGSAYIFSPNINDEWNENMEKDDKYTFPKYELAFEIECGATVGSAAIAAISDGSGDLEIFVPSYELNRVHSFRLHRHAEK